MNKLDYIDMQLEGNATLMEIFERMGAMEFQSELDSSEQSVANSGMKTTSVRLPPFLLEALDAVNKRFEVSRQDAFIYMVNDYISNAVANYAVGRVKAMVDNGVKIENIRVLLQEEYEAIINSMPCDDLTKKDITRISYSHFVVYQNELSEH